MADDLDQLLARGRTGDRSALSSLIKRYQSAVVGLVRSHGVEASSAEDVAQATFVKMVLGLKGLRAGHVFEPWLFQIARNASRDHLRRELWKRRFTEPFESQHAQVAAVVPVDHEEQGGLLDRAISQLDVQEKNLIALTLERPRSYAELAEELGVSISATRSRLFRVRQRLVELLKEGDCVDEH